MNTESDEFLLDYELMRDALIKVNIKGESEVLLAGAGNISKSDLVIRFLKEVECLIDAYGIVVEELRDEVHGLQESDFSCEECQVKDSAFDRIRDNNNKLLNINKNLISGINEIKDIHDKIDDTLENHEE